MAHRTGLDGAQIKVNIIDAMILTIIISNVTCLLVVAFGLRVRYEMRILKTGIEKGLEHMVGLSRVISYQRGWEDAEREKQALLKEIEAGREIPRGL